MTRLTSHGALRAVGRLRRTSGRFAVVVLPVVASLAWASAAEAAPEWVDRPIVLPRHWWAFDFGLGFAHADFNPSITTPGANFDFAVGITERLELGFRAGMRFSGAAGDRALHADEYGRLFDRETFGTGVDTFANPEVRVRGALYQGDVAEIALEGRAILPFESGTHPGFMFGVPLAFHLGHSVRLDTGAYIPIVFNDPNTYYALSIPFFAWFQVSDRVWLGPMTELRFNHFGPGPGPGPGPRGPGDRTDFGLGFGLGVQITRILDFKTMLWFPRVNKDNGDVTTWGVGAGLQVRIE